METWQSIVLAAAVLAIVVNCVVLVRLLLVLGTGSYKQYIQERYDLQGKQHDEQMRKVREEIERANG